MPEVADRFKSGAEPGRNQIAFPRHPEKDQQRDETHEHVQTVKASQGKERGRKHIGAEIDPGLKQFPILRSLTNKEDAAEQDRQSEPAKHGTATLFRQGNLGSPEGETACEKANAKHQRARNIQPFRARTGLWLSIEIQISKDKRGEESCFGKNEAQDPYFVVIGKRYGGALVPYDWVRPVGISYVP